ncbi:MAG TPA: alpha/beta hydrolase [Kribbella sp.]|jgi:pimeloyl-ACP methyl ester carboxylesterase
MLEREVVLVHGLGSTFDHNWTRSGWTDILAAEGFRATSAHLPGHAGAPVDADPVETILGAISNKAAPVAAVGFSAGAAALLEVAAAEPGRFDRIALLGVGDTLLDPPGTGTAVLAEALRGAEEPVEVQARLFWRLTQQAGNERRLVADYLDRLHQQFEPAALGRVTCPVLVVIGDRDEAAPADRLISALPSARGVVLRGVDHFGTTADLRCIEEVVRFIST